ncbi:MAG: hypothetical protein IPH36_09500 [Saprospiraceae bacterium]|nr:hypothetical protein [Saprospiraceae bacterium]
MAVLLVVGLFIYYQTANYGYVLDDQIVITDNQFTKKGFSGIYEILSTESMTGYFGAQQNLVQGNRYRPLSLVTFAMEYGIFNELKPGVSHVINLLLYILSCVFILRLVQLLIPDKKPLMGWFDMGFAAALLYLVHPIHVERWPISKAEMKSWPCCSPCSRSTFCVALHVWQGKKLFIRSPCYLFFRLAIQRKHHHLCSCNSTFSLGFRG